MVSPQLWIEIARERHADRLRRAQQERMAKSASASRRSRRMRGMPRSVPVFALRRREA
jgi:hypothetical protein